ncbi:PAS domain-containing protein [uncultured Jannaschia sp.]|uniref:PAS domain-containing protein n=1 Tax=uncultured Jannaschia sp. TaxID=293347 RepID=UPI002603E8D4|nr:PAS domain-containing protein [uncultured Jannaschia sp.]
MTTDDDWHQTDDVPHAQGRGDPFAAAVRSTRMPMLVSDPRQDDIPIVFANDAFLTLTGYDREEVMGRNCRFLQGPDTDPEKVRKLREAIAREEAIQVDLLNYRKDGTPFWNALFVGPVHNDDGEVQFFFASQIDVTDRVEAQEKVARQKALVEAEVEARTRELKDALAENKRALEEKTILLDEVDHRVKNNLTMIGSLLRLQANSVGEPELARTLGTMLERVDALATVHRTLHQTPDIRRFDVGIFLRGLVSDVLAVSGRHDIEVVDRIEAVDIEAAKATALGLLVNELLTNVVKHAFADGRSGRLTITAKRTGGAVVVELTDDGPGFDPRPCGRSLGLVLVNRLSRQLDGTTEWTSSADGTMSRTRFRSEPAE